MSGQGKRRRIGYLRRTAGVIVSFSPMELAVASLLSGPREFDRLMLIPVGIAAWIAGSNLHHSFIRPWRSRRRHASLENDRFVSSIPIVATIIVLLVVVTNFGARLLAVLGLDILVVDTGGLPWFLIATWPDEGLWDHAG